MGNTKSELIFIILTFYAILTVIMSFVGATINTDLQEQQGDLSGESSLFKDIFTNIKEGYGVLPWWVNLIVFSVPSIILLWIIVSSLPTLNGGG